MPEGVLAVLVAGAVLAAGLAGCAKVPDSGPAVPVGEPGLTQTTEPEIPDVNAQLPPPGADAEVSVAAYLNALGTTRNPGPLGDAYLATAAIRNSFSQSPSVVVVRDVRSSVTDSSSGDVKTAVFSGELIGAVDSEGVFAEAESANWQVQVRMVRSEVRGRLVWLFAEPPPLVVDEGEFTDEFTPVTVYFAAAPSIITGTNPKLVIPERRYVNDDVGGTATQIVDFILAGPSDALSRVAQNPLPKIKRTSRVAVEDGDLVIELEPEAESANKDALDAFVAEVGWTLNGTFSRAVRLLVGGRPLDVSGFAPTQQQGSWKRYNPAVVDEKLPAYQVRAGAVKPLSTVAKATGRLPRLDAPVITSDVKTAAVSVDLTRVAVVRGERAGGQRLWIADSSGTLQPTLRSPSIGRPSWGGNRSTVLVTVGGRLYEVGVGNAKRPLEITVLDEAAAPVRGVTAVRMSLDGVRALVVAGAKVYVGTLTGSTEGGGALVLAVRQLHVDGSPQDVAWYGPVTAAVAVTNSSGLVAVAFAPVDGSPGLSSAANVVPTEPIRVTADPTVNPETAVPLEVGGRIYSLAYNGPRSRTVIPKSGAPFYPG